MEGLRIPFAIDDWPNPFNRITAKKQPRILAMTASMADSIKIMPTIRNFDQPMLEELQFLWSAP